MGKKGRKTKEAEEERAAEAALPETEELPHDRFPPLWRNVRWGQVLFAVLGTVLVLRIRDLARTGELGTLPGGLHILGAVALVFAFVVYLQNMYRHGLVPDYSLKCRFCEGPVNRYSEFCEHCGADLIAEEKLLSCPKCGAEVYEGTKHCPECGASIGKGGKAKKKREAEPPPEEGWSEPLDAASRPPWER